MKVQNLLFGLFIGRVLSEMEHNNINSDGSFAFRHTNSDIGSYYHSASGSPNNIVRGRYGSRNPSNGQVEEVVYTAGPRGFRANGPKIHRKMNLAQYPRAVGGSPDDPLADPYDDPTYSFNFRTPEYSRSEDNDATGRIRGLYSFIDDAGDRHSVRYAAGAGTGFEVSNAVPDNPATVFYSTPLYKSHAKTRGKSSVQRGSNGRYKFIAAGPDHRRAESSGSDGIVRGSYSYLDDKGTQRTVEYIAGAGIGYRIVHNSIGPGTHLNPSVSAFRLGDSNFQLADDLVSGIASKAISSGDLSKEISGEYEYLQTAGSGIMRPKNKVDQLKTSLTSPHNKKDSSSDDESLTLQKVSNENRGKTRYENSNAKRKEESYSDDINDRRKSTQMHSSRGNRKFSSQKIDASDETRKSDDNYSFNDDDFSSIPPLITSNRKILEMDRERDWVEHNRDSTIIKNVGNWYIGLVPGQSVRAHVQNIDIVPLGGRGVPSPSEALRQDELAEN